MARNDDQQAADVSTELDWSQYESPMIGIIHAMARATDQDPEDVPVTTAVDGDAINTLLATASPNGSADVELSFEHQQFRITATSAGHVSVVPIHGRDDEDATTGGSEAVGE